MKKLLIIALFIAGCNDPGEPYQLPPTTTCATIDGLELIGIDKCGCLYGAKLYNQKWEYGLQRKPCL